MNRLNLHRLLLWRDRRSYLEVTMPSWVRAD